MMDDKRINRQSEVLKALGEPLRLRILQLLPDTDSCEDVYNVSELAEELGVAQPTVSHHLGILKRAGVVNCKKMCREVYYWIDRKTLSLVLKGVLDDTDSKKK